MMTADNVPDRLLQLPDGRALGYRVWGDPAGTPLLFLHGTPGSRLKLGLGHRAAMGLGLAIVAPDRWGYGLTDLPPVPSLAAFATDMAALMDHLGHTTFAVGGISGGGPYATAVAAHLGTRVGAVALVSPMGPVAELAAHASLAPFHRLCFAFLPQHPWATRAVFRAFRASLARSPRLAARLATLRGGRHDRAALAQPEIARWLLGSFREGLRRGLQGPVTDLRLFSTRWGIDPRAVRAPSRLWIGTADTAVPLSAARLLGQSLPACAVTELAGEGHFWIATNYAEVLAWVAQVVHSTLPRARGATGGF